MRSSLVSLIMAFAAWPALAEEPPQVDRYGDPLPDHAVMRLGTTRLRHTSHVEGVAFSPDGQILASAGWDGAIRLWESDSGKEVRLLADNAKFGVYAVAFSPDGTKLAAAGEGGRVRLWDVATAQKLFESQKHEGRAHSVDFSPDGLAFATVGGDGAVRLWDTATGVELLALQTADSLGDLAFSPDGSLLASGSAAKIRLWSVENGQANEIENAHGDASTSLVFLPNGKSLIASGESKYRFKTMPDGKRIAYALSEIRMWDVASGELVRDFRLDEPTSLGECSLALSKDDCLLASAHHKKIVIWDAKTGRPVRTIAAHNSTFRVRTRGLAISPDGMRLAVCGPDHAIQMYDTLTGEPLLSFDEAHEDRIICATVSSSGKLLATGSGDNSVRLWDLDTGRQLRRVQFGYGNSSAAFAVAFGRSDETVTAAGYHCPDYEFIGFLGLYEVTSGKPLWEQNMTGRATTMALSPDGNMVAVATGLGAGFLGETAPLTISLWNVASREERAVFEGHQGMVKGMAFALGGKTLFSADERMTIRRWNLEQNELHSTMNVSGHQRSRLRSVAFGPDGSVAVTSGLFGSLLIVWDLKTGQEIRRMDVENSPGSTLAISPDGRLLASGSIGLTSTTQAWDAAIRIWDLSEGRELLRFDLKDIHATVLTFSPDGRQLISGMDDTTILVWDISGAHQALSERK